MNETVTVDEAIVKGHRMVNYPVFIIMFGTIGFCFFKNLSTVSKRISYLSTIIFAVHRKFSCPIILNSKFERYYDFQVKFMVKIWGKEDG